MTLYQAKLFSIGMSNNNELDFTAFFTDRQKAVDWCLYKANTDMPYYMMAYPDIDIFVGVREWVDANGKFCPVGMHFLTEYVHDLDGNVEPLNVRHLDLDYFSLDSYAVQTL